MMEKKRKYYFSTFDLILMAIIAGIGGVINGAYMYPFIQPFKLLFPFLGNLAGIPLTGLYVIWPIIVRLLIRKRGASTLYGIIQGCIEYFGFGNPLLGPWAILVATTEGFLIDVAFAFFKERAALLSSILGGALATLLADLIFFFLRKMISPRELYVGGLVAILSGIILGGILGWLVGKAIYNTGIIKRGNL